MIILSVVLGYCAVIGLDSRRGAWQPLRCFLRQETLYLHCLSLPRQHSAEGNPVMDQHSIQEEYQYS